MNAAIIVAVMYGHVSDTLVLSWVAALLVTVGARAVLFNRFQNNQPHTRTIRSWAGLYAAGTVASGVIWGLAGWVFVVPDLPHTQLVTTIIIAGMVAGALSTLRTMPHLFVAFAVSAVLPLIVRFLLFQHVEYVLLCGAFSLFLLLMSMQAFTISRQLRLSEARRITNLALVENLHAAKISAEAANEAKSTFLATMSHEIRTPMTGVMGFADGLLDDGLPAASKAKVERIKESTQALLQIINEVLDISKLEAGKMEIENLDFNLPSLLENVMSLFQGGAQNTVSIEMELDDRLPAAIHGDPSRLRQVLLNLVGNAVKFTKEGQIRVLAERDREALRFSVTDTGIGIGAETLPKLFSDFTQADSSISREFEGTGLGLAICKRLIELMGGEVGVESELGAGSTFWFTLPYVPAKSDTIEFEASGGGSTQEVLMVQPLHILVAEDNEINRMIIAETLHAFGHSFEMVNDGEEAVEAHTKGDYDLILMDIRMPKVSGPDATRIIRRMGADKKTISIVALTADAMVEHRKRYIEAGMNAVATKPIDRVELAMAINDATGQKIHTFQDAKDGPPSSDPSDKPDEPDQADNPAINDFLAEIESLSDQGEHR
ncbi:MAG: response regulator [Rhodospirillaceae bacterium]|nr:response regulator [Rhodospirillaceae bacterium]